MIEKALIYATNSCGILVFDEPDFPEVPLQVPGGTVEEGEPVIDAARREFGDETGLVDRTGFRLLGTATAPLHEMESSITFIAHIFTCRLRMVFPTPGIISMTTADLVSSGDFGCKAPIADLMLEERVS
ncbi:NUDIX domain-containing protein [Rhizobium laguerreae]